MKKLFVILFLALATGISAAAQSIIVTNDGGTVKAYNIEVTGNSVYFQTAVTSDSPIQKMNKSDILIIKMEDGTKLDPNAPEQPSQEAAAPVAQVGETLKISGEVAEKNAAMIADFNRELTWEPDAKFLKNHQGKIGNGYAGIMWVEEDSQLYNGEVTISYQRVYHTGVSVMGGPEVEDYRSNVFMYPMVVVKVKNNTDRIIYLDLGSSFVTCEEDSVPFFVPEITTVSNTNTDKKSSEYSDLKVSDSSISTSDRKYSSDKSSSVTTVKKAQRYVSVAPKSTLALDPKPLCENDYRGSNIYRNYSNLQVNQSVFPFTNTPYGVVFEIEKEYTPFRMGSCVTYSFNADHSHLRTIRTELYLKYVMCTSSSKTIFPYTIEGDFHKRYPYWVPFFVVGD